MMEFTAENAKSAKFLSFFVLFAAFSLHRRGNWETPIA